MDTNDTDDCADDNADDDNEERHKMDFGLEHDMIPLHWLSTESRKKNNDMMYHIQKANDVNSTHAYWIVQQKKTT